MFLRVTKVKRQGKQYSYAQFVESYRRNEDGLPAHRVVANLGQLSELEIENLKTAIRASKDQKKAVFDLTENRQIQLSKPTKNLIYLDLATLFETWKKISIARILQESLPKTNSKISSADIISALCLHRCLDAGSKLSATRWFNSTSLQELTGIDVANFNNTRIHRAMYDLEQGRQTLMAKLPLLYQKNASDMSALFLDVSNVWFCGAGPEVAEKGLSKDGAIRKQIGVVLLCNKDGLPMRWEVVGGASTDNRTMTNTIEEVRHLNWISGVPLVCDRAMGQTSTILKLYKFGVQFLTAVTRLEYANYGAALAKDSLEFEIDRLTEEDIASKARSLIRKSKRFTEVSPDLFTIDLGTVSVTDFEDGDDRSKHIKVPGNRIQTAMQLGQSISVLVQTQRFGSVIAAGAHLGLKPGLAAKYMNLTKLPDQVQEAILEGKANNCSINVIEQIAIKEKPELMFENFAEHVELSNKTPKRMRRDYNQVYLDSEAGGTTGKIKIRVVAYFNPQMYADQKDRSRRWLSKLEKFQKDLNKRLLAPSNKRGRDSIVSEIDRFIRKKDLLQCVDVKVEQEVIEQRKVWQVNIDLIQEKWQKRRQYDGFCILVCHPECSLSADELCKLYRGKDVIEKDFQTIKSVLNLRPVRHYQDLKVRAHVTICMLSLLLEKALQKQLGGNWTPRRALEELRSCHLNKYVINEKSYYTITELDESQKKILKTLELTHLADDEYLLERIRSR
jgi:transposase